MFYSKQTERKDFISISQVSEKKEVSVLEKNELYETKVSKRRVKIFISSIAKKYKVIVSNSY